MNRFLFSVCTIEQNYTHTRYFEVSLLSPRLRLGRPPCVCFYRKVIRFVFVCGDILQVCKWKPNPSYFIIFISFDSMLLKNVREFFYFFVDKRHLSFFIYMSQLLQNVVVVFVSDFKLLIRRTSAHSSNTTSSLFLCTFWKFNTVFYRERRSYSFYLWFFLLICLFTFL